MPTRFAVRIRDNRYIGRLPSGVGENAFIDQAEAMDYREIITLEPGKRGGKPCIRGMRITVYDVLSYLASGMTPTIFFVWQERRLERSREFEQHAAPQRRRIELPCHSRRVQRNQGEKSICFMGRYKVGLVLGVL